MEIYDWENVEWKIWGSEVDWGEGEITWFRWGVWDCLTVFLCKEDLDKNSEYFSCRNSRRGRWFYNFIGECLSDDLILEEGAFKR